MKIITRTRIAEFAAFHPAAASPLLAWQKVISIATFTCFADVRKTYNSADQVGEYIVFNVSSYRLVTYVHYQNAHRTGTVFIQHVFTHTDYEDWTRKNRKGIK